MFGSKLAMKSGLGTASVVIGNGIIVGAIVAVNAVGDVIDPVAGKVIAGARTKDGKALLGSMNAILRGEPLPRVWLS